MGCEQLPQIFEAWELPIKTQCILLGGVSNYRLKKILAGGRLSQDESTRVCFLELLFKYLHINNIPLHEKIPDPMFRGETPLDLILRFGVPGMFTLDHYLKKSNKSMRHTLREFHAHIGDRAYDEEAIHAYIFKYGGINFDTDIVCEGNVVLLSKSALERLY